MDFEKSLERMLSNQSLDEALSQLRRETGAHIVDAIKALRTVRGLSLGEAKKLVVASRVWEDAVNASEPLHDELIRLTEK